MAVKSGFGKMLGAEVLSVCLQLYTVLSADIDERLYKIKYWLARALLCGPRHEYHIG